MRRALLIAALAAVPTASARAADIPGPQHRYAVTREASPGLLDHTLIRPSDIDTPQFKMPIVVWANGGCRDSNEEFHYFLTHFAAYGYFIVANGPPENPYHPEELEGIANPQPKKLTDAMNWAVANATRYNLDTSRIVVMGQSCGAWEGIDASADKRVKSTISWNNGGDPHAGDVTKLHAPTLYVRGGNSDYTSAETVQAYTRTTVPTVLGNLAPAGHTGMWDDPTDPSQETWQGEPLVVGAKWLAFTLYGDDAARAYFLGADCGLCQRKDWDVQSKNWSGWKAPAADGDATPATPPSGSAPAAAKPACTSKRRITVHARRGVHSARLYVDGKRVGTLGRRGRTVSFAGHAGGTVVVRIVGRNAKGKRVVDVRRYKLCK